MRSRTGLSVSSRVRKIVRDASIEWRSNTMLLVLIKRGFHGSTEGHLLCCRQHFETCTAQTLADRLAQSRAIITCEHHFFEFLCLPGRGMLPVWTFFEFMIFPIVSENHNAPERDPSPLCLPMPSIPLAHGSKFNILRLLQTRFASIALAYL